MRARSVQTALPEMSLPSHTASGLACPGISPKMSPRVTSFGREVRDLDADRLLARDRGKDPDLGRRERIGEVVLETGDLGDLGPGRELELVADDARAGDLADDRGVDAEVRERLDELLGGAGARDAVVALDRRRRLQQRAVRQTVLAGRRRLEIELFRPRRHRIGTTSSSGITSGGGSGAAGAAAIDVG